MSGEPDSLVGCDIRLLTTRTEQEKHRKIKINLWKVRGGGVLTGAFWLFIYKRRKRDISLSFSYGRVSPWPASVGINQIIKLNFRS